VDPTTIPKHNGGDQGCMEARIRAGTDTRIAEAGYGRRGAPVFESNELGDARFYGSATVISLNEQPQLPQEIAPPVKARTPEEILAMMAMEPKK
jgi:hypothetical protein